MSLTLTALSGPRPSPGLTTSSALDGRRSQGKADLCEDLFAGRSIRSCCARPLFSHESWHGTTVHLRGQFSREIGQTTSVGGINRPINVSAMIDEFEKSKMAYALLGFGIFSYMSAEDANKKMAADWTSKELPKELLVSPDRRAAGFLYIKLPKGEKPTGMEVIVPVENLETKVTQTLRLRL